MASEFSQTDSPVITDQLSQTESTPLKEAPVQATVTMCMGIQQTDVQEVSCSHMQTDSSMALQEDRHSQTLIPVQNVDSQTEIDNRDSSCQAVVTESHATMQTDAPQLGTTLSQTDMSLANQVEQEAQAVVSVATKISQIQADCQDTLVQTASSISLLTDAESQHEATPIDSTHSQTDAADVLSNSMQTDQVHWNTSLLFGGIIKHGYHHSFHRF